MKALKTAGKILKTSALHAPKWQKAFYLTGGPQVTSVSDLEGGGATGPPANRYTSLPKNFPGESVLDFSWLADPLVRAKA